MPTRLYDLVTKYWYQIAATIVLLLGALELLVEGITDDSRIEFYLMTWAATTGGVWFLFDKAESILSDETKTKLAQWVVSYDFQLRQIPRRFALTFDSVFGADHFSVKCFLRSAIASLLAIILMSAFTGDFSNFRDIFSYLIFGSILFNLLIDYLSLLETRWLLRWSENMRLSTLLLIDVLITFTLYFVVWYMLWFNFLYLILQFYSSGGQQLANPELRFESLWAFVSHWRQGELSSLSQFWTHIITTVPTSYLSDRAANFYTALFYSTFFTSLWLWLFIIVVIIARSLAKVETWSRVLLSLSDLNKQPLRSLGFVSIILVSILYLLGLPLVLL